MCDRLTSLAVFESLSSMKSSSDSKGPTTSLDQKEGQQPATSTIIKTIYLIRHAESEENRRLAALFNIARSLGRFSLPSLEDVYSSMELLNVYNQIDSPVSAKGREQISDMATQLEQSNFLEKEKIERVIHSPLERARQTAQGLFPQEKTIIFENNGNVPNNTASTSSSTDVAAAQSIPFYETDLLIEKTPSEWIPGNYSSFLERIFIWEDWLLQQPETRIAVVGHSQFFKAMLNLDYKFKNCDVWKVTFSRVEQKAEDDYVTRKYVSSWSDLEHKFTCMQFGELMPANASSNNGSSD